MALWTFFLPSLLAVALLVWLARHLYGYAHPTIPDPQTARRRYLQDFFEDRVEGVLLDARGRHALLLLDDPMAVGLVIASGDKLVTRRLEPALLKDVETGKAIWRLRLEDLVLPDIALTFEEGATTSPVGAQLHRRLVCLASRATTTEGRSEGH